MPAKDARRVLLISGSLRQGSTNTAVLRTAGHLAPPSVVAIMYEGVAGVPAFNPDLDTEPLPPAVADLRRQISRTGRRRGSLLVLHSRVRRSPPGLVQEPPRLDRR